MNSTLTAGTRIVVLALLFYSIGVLTEQRRRLITNAVLISLTLGILFDITATAFMIIGSPNSPFTLHGFLGYSALAAMLADTILVWRFRLRHGAAGANPDTVAHQNPGFRVPRGLHLYSRYAYLWWVVAFISGSMIVILK